MTIPHNYRIARTILLPIALAAWLATLAAIAARPDYPDDATDIALLTAQISAAIAAASLAVTNPRRGYVFASLPLAAGLYSLAAGPSILWKMHIPLAFFTLLAAAASRHLVSPSETNAPNHDSPPSTRTR